MRRPDGDRTLLLELAALIVAMGALKGVLMFFRRWLAGRLSLAVEFDLRNAHVHATCSGCPTGSSTATRPAS